MSVFILKIIAVFCMVCDHIRYITPSLNNEYTRLLGRIAFPIFAFLISEGYSHTKDIKKYIQRLWIFAIISEIPFLMFTVGCNITKQWGINVIFTLLCGVLAILSYDKIKNIYLKVLSIVSIILLAEFSHMDYGALGVLLILNFYILKDRKILKLLIFSAGYIADILWQLKDHMNERNLIYCLPYMIGYICSAILLYFYNQKKGKFKLKYFFYIFYPLHMILIFFIYKFVN